MRRRCCGCYRALFGKWRYPRTWRTRLRLQASLAVRNWVG